MIDKVGDTLHSVKDSVKSTLGMGHSNTKEDSNLFLLIKGDILKRI